jgi:hypothetical protein
MRRVEPAEPRPADPLRHLPRLHFALAAVAFLAAVAVAFPVAAGWQALAAPGRAPDPAGGPPLPPPSASGWIFLVGGALAVALGAALSVALVLAGRAIAARRSHGFCLATAFAASFFFPLGTLLGFHTIDVLCAPSAREAFGLPARARPGR